MHDNAPDLDANASAGQVNDCEEGFEMILMKAAPRQRSAASFIDGSCSISPIKTASTPGG